jgi:hypothetical protein
MLLLGLLVSCRSPQSASLDELPPPGPPPPPAGSFLAQLTPEVTAELEALNIPVAIPTYLPEGFALVDHETGKSSPDPDGGPDYWLVYRDVQNHCFAIEYASGGIGGPGLEKQLPINSPLFGSGYQLHYGSYDDPELRQQFPEPDLFSDWLKGDQGFYRLAGAQLTMQTYDQAGCINLPPEEAVKIVESLTYLQTDLTDLYGEG